VNKLLSFALGTLMSVVVASSAWAAGNVPTQRGSDQAIEVIIVKAKRLPPEATDAVIVTAKRPALRVEARTPPAMPIEIPRLEFAVAAPPVVAL
jgi:hypothetical protein